MLGSKHSARSPFPTGTGAATRPRTKVVTSARLEIPQRPSNGVSDEAHKTDAFKELVALSKKQSVNRVQSVGLRLTCIEEGLTCK